MRTSLHTGSITHLEFPSRSHLLSASEDGTLCLFRARDWAVLREMKGHKGRVNSVAVHHSCKVALSVGKDRTLRMWDLMRGKGSASTKIGKGMSKLNPYADTPPSDNPSRGRTRALVNGWVDLRCSDTEYHRHLLHGQYNHVPNSRDTLLRPPERIGYGTLTQHYSSVPITRHQVL